MEKERYGTIMISGTELNTDEGNKYIKRELKRILKDLKTHGMLIREMKVNIEFENPNQEVDGDYIFPETKIPNPNVDIDRTEFDCMLNFDYIEDVRIREILKLIDSYRYEWIDQKQLQEFADKLIQIYNKGGFKSLKEVIDPEFDPSDVCYTDIGDIFNYLKLSYDIRRVGNRYQIKPELRISLL